MSRVNENSKSDMDDVTADKFIDEVVQISRKYGLSIAHQDVHGAFVIEKFDEDNIRWLKDAHNEAKYQ